MQIVLAVEHIQTILQVLRDLDQIVSFQSNPG